MKTQTLFCKAGQHEWEREVKRGKRPQNCPEHTPTPATVLPVDGEDPLVKARRKSAATRTKKAQELIWDQVQSYRKLMGGCGCDLRPGMTHDDLLRLGTGCTSNWVCPVLDKYRRLVGS